MACALQPTWFIGITVIFRCADSFVSFMQIHSPLFSSYLLWFLQAGTAAAGGPAPPPYIAEAMEAVALASEIGGFADWLVTTEGRMVGSKVLLPSDNKTDYELCQQHSA